MELIRGIHNLRFRHRGCVATIGNFDGVHLGHQSVLVQLRGYAESLGLPMAVIVFEPQPQEFFDPAGAPARLTRWREKFEFLAEYGVDRMICLRFDEALATLDANAFIEQLLIQGLNTRCLVAGDDFRFGSGRQGDFTLLQMYAAEHGFDIVRAATCVMDGERVSSTRLRQLLAAGKMAEAQRLLGRPYSISGRIVHGHKRGRSLGFATANIDLHRLKVAVKGVFAAQVHGIEPGRALPAMAYVGRRPIIDDERNILEVHVFDFEQTCYGQHVRVDFLSKLRDDTAFASFEELREQIASDAIKARKILEKSCI